MEALGLHLKTGCTKPSSESKPEVTENVFEDKMFDFFINQEAVVLPKESDPAKLFFSSSSNESPSVCEEDDQPQADPMLSTMKANLSRIGQLMDSLAVRARIVSDSEVLNSRNVSGVSISGVAPEGSILDEEAKPVSTYRCYTDGEVATHPDKYQGATPASG